MKGALRLRGRVQADIPTASMADIAFLLIIFFMITTVFTATKGIEYGLPKQDPEAQVQPLESVYIRLRADRGLEVDRRPMADTDELAAYVAAKMAETENRKPVIIRTDADAPYGRMIDVLDVLKGLDVRTVAIPTQTEIEQWIDYFGE